MITVSLTNEEVLATRIALRERIIILTKQIDNIPQNKEWMRLIKEKERLKDVLYKIEQ